MDIKKIILLFISGVIILAACNNDADQVQTSEQTVSVSDTGYKADSSAQNDEADETDEDIVTEDDVIYSADGKILISFPADRTGEFTVPDGTEVIGEKAFYQSQLTSVILPEGLKSIGALAFAHANITEIYLPDSIESCAMIFGHSEDNPTINVPASAAYNDGMLALKNYKNIIFRNETDLELLIRKTGDLNTEFYSGRIFIDLDGDSFPEMVEMQRKGNGVELSQFDTDRGRWKFCGYITSNTGLSLYRDKTNGEYFYIFPVSDEDYTDYLVHKIDITENGFRTYENLFADPENYIGSHCELIDIVDIEKIAADYGDEDKKYEIVMEAFADTPQPSEYKNTLSPDTVTDSPDNKNEAKEFIWRNTAVTEFPYTTKWYSEKIEITINGADILNGDAVDGAAYKGGKLRIDGLNIDGDIVVNSKKHFEIEISGNNSINNLLFNGPTLIISGDGTLTANTISDKKYSLYYSSAIDIRGNAHIICREDFGNSSGLSETIFFNELYIKDNSSLQCANIGERVLSISGNAHVSTAHCSAEFIKLRDSSVIEIVSSYEKYPELEITDELNCAIYNVRELTIRNDARLSVKCGSAKYGIYSEMANPIISLIDNSVLDISGSSVCGIMLNGYNLGSLRMNGDPYAAVSSSGHTIYVGKIVVNGGTLDIHTDEEYLAGKLPTMNYPQDESEAGLYINGDVISQSCDWTYNISDFYNGYGLIFYSAETGETLKDLSVTVKEKTAKK